MGIEDLSPEERRLLKELMHKAGLNPGKEHSGNPGNPDPPEERYALGPRLPEVEDWVGDWEVGVKAKARKWKSRTLHPKKPPITRGIAAEDKFRDKMSVVLDQELRKKGLEQWTDEEWGERVAEVKPEDYSSGAIKKRYKMAKKIAAQRELRIYIAEKIDAMPDGTREERDAKILANKHCMEIVGLFVKGVIDLAEAKRRVDAEVGS